MSVERVMQRPAEVRSVPVLNDPDVGHYPEFRDFLVNVFDLQEDPLGAPGLLSVSGRIYELIFAGRSGQPFPAAIEISVLVPGLEPMDTDQTDKDLWEIMEWITEGVGEPWSLDALRTTGKIYRVIE
jgi:hypothetical protein